MAAPQNATKPSPRAGLQLADGGSVGQQPMLALADGGPTSLNSNTSGFNFGDWLRQQQAGNEGSSAYQINQTPAAAPAAAPATGGGKGIPQDSGPTRDLTKDPLSGTENTMLNAGQRVLERFGPIGSVISSGIDYNRQKANMQDQSSTTLGANIAQTGGFFSGLQGYMNDKMNAVKNTFQDLKANTDSDPLGAKIAMNGGWGTIPGPAPQPQIGEVQDGGGGSGVTVGGPIAPSTIQTNDLGPLSGGGAPPAAPPAPVAPAAALQGWGQGNDGDGGSDADGGQLNTMGTQRPGGQQAVNTAPPGPPGLSMPGAAQAPAPQQPMHPALAQLHVQNKMANPQMMQQMQTHLTQAIQSGAINPQQIQMMGQLAQSAMQHPELWDKLRQFAIQAGLPDAQQLPPQFNQQVCMALLAASHAAAHGDRPGAFADGGKLNGPGTGISDSINAHNTSTGQPVKLSNGEYIIPADVVATKGKEFFDNIVRKYHTPAAMQHGR